MLATSPMVTCLQLSPVILHAFEVLIPNDSSGSAIRTFLTFSEVCMLVLMCALSLVFSLEYLLHLYFPWVSKIHLSLHFLHIRCWQKASADYLDSYVWVIVVFTSDTQGKSSSLKFKRVTSVNTGMDNFSWLCWSRRELLRGFLSVRKLVLNKQFIAFCVSETYLPLNYNCLWRGRRYSNLLSMRTLPRSQDLSPEYVLCYCGIIWKRENQNIDSITNLLHPISLALYGYGVS